MIKADLSDDEANSLKDGKSETRIYFQLNKGSEMNVQLFGGKNRREATKSIIKYNFQAEVGKKYSIDYQEGILVVAYPNKD